MKAKGPEVLVPLVEKYMALKKEKEETDSEAIDKLAAEHLKEHR